MQDKAGVSVRLFLAAVRRHTFAAFLSTASSLYTKLELRTGAAPDRSVDQGGGT